MLGRLFVQARQFIYNFENNLYLILGKRSPPDSFCILGIDVSKSSTNESPKSNSFSLEALLNDSILWGVPTHRRTTERRMSRKFGWPNQVWKLIVPKKNLLMCGSCGNHHTAGHLCPTCYSKVKKETEEMKKVIEAELGLDPVDKEVVVLYQGEREGVPDEYFKGKRIIEMKKERPPWFSKNLLEKTTQAPATTTSVKPTNLA